jgi:hypothetical protein
MGNFPFRACAYPIERALSPLAAEISSRERDELMPPQRWRAIKAVHYLIKYLSNAQDSSTLDCGHFVVSGDRRVNDDSQQSIALVVQRGLGARQGEEVGRLQHLQCMDVRRP